MPKQDPTELIGPEKGPKLSPLLDKHEKDVAMNLGHSLDAKKVTSALGYLDLKQICFCLANTLMRHIEFSRGKFFIQDLKENKEVEADIEFSYKLGELKIDVEQAKRNAENERAEKRAKKEEETKAEVEQLKKDLEDSIKRQDNEKTRQLDAITPKLRASKAAEIEEVEEEIKDESGIDNQERSEEEFYEDDFEKKDDKPAANEDLGDLDMDYS